MKNGFKEESVTRLNFNPRITHFVEGKLGQNAAPDLESLKSFPYMLLPRFVWFCLYLIFLFSFSNAFAQTNYYSTNGAEYAIVGSLPGDQVYPDVALNSAGGFVVWQDNATDGDGWGVSARRLDSTFSGTLSTFRVNVNGTNDQENARVALLKNGGAVFVWQGGKEGLDQHIYARFLSSSNTWLTSDVLVNTLVTNVLYSYLTNSTKTIKTNWNVFHTRITGYTTNVTTTITTNQTKNVAGLQIDPAVTVLSNGNAVITWSSFDQATATSMQDVCAQIFSPAGVRVGTNFLVNQFTSYNQRNPSIVALRNGGFAISWVSEQERVLSPTSFTNTMSIPPSVDIYARVYGSNGIAQGNEFLVNMDANPCADPSMASGSDGGFIIAWDARDMGSINSNSLDIYARSFSSVGVGGAVMRVNSFLYGDQYSPRIASSGTDYMVVWTSLGQDGSWEGVYAQFLSGDGTKTGGEMRINSTTIGRQLHSTITSDGNGQFLALWASYATDFHSFDLFAQRYGNADTLLNPMGAPYVYAPFTISNGVYQPQLQVTWAPLQGISVASYEVYVDGAASPTGIVTSNMWIMTAANGLTTNSTHSFTVDYVTTDGRHSPMSPSAGGTTWSGLNWYGIPYEWMAMYFGGYYSGAYHTNFWPSPDTTVASGGPTLLQIFQTGADPFDSGTWLVVSLNKTSQGMFVDWNTQPGLTYQLQMTTNLTTWSNIGSPRFAPGSSDSVNVGSGGNSYYRVILVR